MGKKLTIEEGEPILTIDIQKYQEDIMKAAMEAHMIGVEAGKVLAYEKIKRILSSARLTHDVKTQIWYLIDECQKNQ